MCAAADPLLLAVQRLHEQATIPRRATPGSAGYDLSSVEAYTLLPNERQLVRTGLAVALPPSTYGRVADRSGLAYRAGLRVGAGVIDSDYRGELMVLLFNHSDQPFRVNRGDRVAQLIVERHATPEVVEVRQLPDSIRGQGGFGSTG